MKIKLRSTQDQLQFDAVKACGHEAVIRFIEMVQKGESVKMAAMLATQKPPGRGFDDNLYQKNSKSVLEQLDGSKELYKAWNDQYRKETGENIPPGAVINRGLAHHIGDSKVVLTHKWSMADIVRTMKERGCEVEGDIDIESAPAAPVVQEVRLADDLIENCVEEYIVEDPELALQDRDELREMVVDKHSKPIATASNLNPMGTKNFKDLSACLFV
jgi:hypothetical protein